MTHKIDNVVTSEAPEKPDRKLIFDTSDDRQVRSMVEWMLWCETPEQDLIGELAGRFVTIKRQIEGSPIFGVDFCDRAINHLYNFTMDCDKASSSVVTRSARLLPDCSKVRIERQRVIGQK